MATKAEKEGRPEIQKFEYKINEDLKSKIRRINLKLILLNQLKWILAELFRILCRQYQPTQFYLRVGMSSLTQTSFFLICMVDSMDAGYLACASCQGLIYTGHFQDTTFFKKDILRSASVWLLTANLHLVYLYPCLTFCCIIIIWISQGIIRIYFPGSNKVCYPFCERNNFIVLLMSGGLGKLYQQKVSSLHCVRFFL